MLEAHQRYLRTGSNWSLRPGMSYDDYQYIIKRRQELKEQGEMSLAGKEYLDKMFTNLREEDRLSIDKLTRKQLMRKYDYVWHGRPNLDWEYLFLTDADKAKKDYTYYRFEELMAKEPIDFRDPQFMEKLNSHINETGLNPFTGKPATEGEKLVAKHYGWVKSSSTIATSVIGALIDFSDITSTSQPSKLFISNVEDIAQSTLYREKVLQNIENSRMVRDSRKNSDWNSYIQVESIIKYPTAIDSQVVVVDKVKLPEWIGSSFKDGHYRTVVTTEDITVYRVFGNKARATGAFVTSSPAQNRIQAKLDSALLPEWKNSIHYEAKIVIPAGTRLNIGKVEKQYTLSGTKLEGNADQFLLPEEWPEEWIVSVRNINP